MFAIGITVALLIIIVPFIPLFLLLRQIYRNDHTDLIFCVILGFWVTGTILLVSIPIALSVFACFDGINPNYVQNGEINGYVADVWNEGILWKTNEVRIYELQPYHKRLEHRFSTPNDELAQRLHDNIGKYVVIHYREWWIGPHRIGETDQEIMDVQSLSEEEVKKIATWQMSTNIKVE